jgi:hypothetical protein
MDSERLASAHRTEGVRSAVPVTTSSGFAMMVFKITSAFLASSKWSYPKHTLLFGLAEDAPFALY